MDNTEGRLSALEANEKTIFKRLDKQDGRIDKLERLLSSVEKIAAATEANTKTLEKIDKRLTEIEQKPAKKWEKATETIWVAILTGLVGAFLGALLSMLFK